MRLHLALFVLVFFRRAPAYHLLRLFFTTMLAACSPADATTPPPHPPPPISPTPSPPQRVVLLNAGPQPHRYAGNAVSTAKYTLISFWPRLLFEQFSRAAYLYFLAQACLAWWPAVSPYNPWGSTLALAFVLLVAAAREAYEDLKRRRADVVANAKRATVLCGDGAFAARRWRDVRVGDLLLVNSDEELPADLLLLHASTPQHTFVQTSNLDGETSLKPRRSVRLGSGAVTEACDESTASRMVASIACDAPSAELGRFSGTLTLWRRAGGGSSKHTLSLDNLLPRGSRLVNSGRVLGVVLYAGVDSKVYLNQKKVPYKQGAYSHFLNAQIWLLLFLQLLLCLAFATADWAWQRAHSSDWYLDWSSRSIYGPSAVGRTFLEFLTFWCAPPQSPPCAAGLLLLRMMTTQNFQRQTGEAHA